MTSSPKSFKQIEKINGAKTSSPNRLVNFRRRSLDDLDLMKKFHFYDSPPSPSSSIVDEKCAPRRSNSCFSFSEEKILRKKVHEPPKKSQNPLLDSGKSIKVMKVSPGYNPFPVKRETHLIERGKKFGLYANK